MSFYNELKFTLHYANYACPKSQKILDFNQNLLHSNGQKTGIFVPFSSTLHGDHTRLHQQDVS